jgi:dihydrofolate reductase
LTPSLTLIAARGSNGCIGLGGALPWRLPSDLKRFKAMTLGKPVLMGRKTWDSIGKPLPGRDNLVLSRDSGFQPPGAWAFASLEVLLAAGAAIARAKGASEVCVIGGAALYEAALPLAQRLVLTEVALSPDGDAFFPKFEEQDWKETAREALRRGEKDDADAVVRILERRGASL